MDNPTLDTAVLSGDLRAALAATKRATQKPDKHGRLPILTYGMVETREGSLWMHATNLEWAIAYRMGGKVRGEGRALLPVHQLAAAIPAKPTGPVHITANGKDVSIELPSGAKLNYHNDFTADDFPSPVRPPDREPDLSWDGAELLRVIGSVTPAAAPDMERPILAGVCLDIHEAFTILVAADSFRLAIDQAMPDLMNADLVGKQVIIPAASLRVLAQLIGKPAKLAVDNEPVRMWHLADRTQVMFATDRWVLVSQLVVGVFPDWRQIVPASNPYRHTVPTAELAAAVKTAAPIARQANGIIRFSRNNGSLTVSAVSGEGGNVALKVPATGEGEGRWALNFKYIADALATIPTEHVTIETGSPSTPVMLRPTERISNLAWLIMPMYVAD